jgi:hypothetical protein
MSTDAINAAALLMDRGVPGRLAISCNGHSIRWDELRSAVARAGAAWRDCGVERGECVQLHVPRGIDMAIAYLGVVWAGAVPVPLAREVSLAGQPWDAQAPCRFILARSRGDYVEGWRDSVLTLDEWAMYFAESQPCAPQRMAPNAPACWTEPRTRDGSGARLLPHAFASSPPAALPRTDATTVSTVLGLLKVLRRGGTAVIGGVRQRAGARAALEVVR